MKSLFVLLGTWIMVSNAIATTTDPVASNLSTGKNVLECTTEILNSDNLVHLTSNEIQGKVNGKKISLTISDVQFKMIENDLGLLSMTNLLDPRGKVIAVHYQQDGKESVRIANVVLPCLPRVL